MRFTKTNFSLQQNVFAANLSQNLIFLKSEEQNIANLVPDIYKLQFALTAPSCENDPQNGLAYRRNKASGALVNYRYWS